MEIATIADAFVVNRIILNGHPVHTRCIDFTSLEKLAFLDLKMNDAIMLEEANASDNPEKVKTKLKLNPREQSALAKNHYILLVMFETT